MLSSTTKQKIDNARNILVGKIPTPTGQVEHITLALMYKFMHDMDELSKSLGGKAKFFAGEYRQYAWKRIMDPGISAHERVNLYSQGLEKMGKNPGLPQLFRDIFKRAFLPFRDPEVLSLFLKQIDEFNYDHSEELGNAFEYLLSIMGTQGEAGQLRTPRHIIDFIVKVVDPKKTDRILDPACGTAGFLISAYKHILDENTDKRTNKPGSKLTQGEKTRLSKNFVGYDISHDMVRLSLVNMYLHNFPDPKIYEYDTLASEEKWDEDFDCILANPPFMSPKGGIRPHRRFQIQANRSEVLFVDYIAEHLSTSGKAGVIVPEGIIFQSANAYKALRKMLVENHLWAVVSLPAGAFNPYSGVKTSILFLDKVLAKKTQNMLFVKVKSDGFDLGAQRRPIDKDDLPQAREVLGRYKQTLEISEGDKTRAIIVAKSRIAEDGDYTLTGDRYKDNGTIYGNWPMLPIGDICDLINGRAFKPSDWEKKEQGGLPIIRIQNLNDNDTEFNYYSGKVDDKHIVNNGDLLFSWSGSKGSSFGSHIWRGEQAVLNQHIFRVEHTDSVLKEYLYYALKKIVVEVEDNLHGGVGLVHITKGNLEKIRLALPPFDVQQEIIAEIEGYRKIIDGAKQVVASYKPQIKIDPTWEIKLLKDICENLDSKRVPITQSDRKNGKYPYYGASGIVDYVDDYLFDEDLLLVSEDGANLLARSTPIAFSVSGKIWVNNHAHALRFESSVTQKCVELYLNSISLEPYITGSAQPKLNKDKLNNIPIPIPPLEIQKQIVILIEEEQKLVEANKRLVEIFEWKIKNKIDEVWGKGVLVK